jgi:hypothetical protein
MDNGLERVQGRRLPTEILDVDLPDLARALTSLLRKQATTQPVRVGDARYVQITGRGLNSVVPEADWEKILPLIKNGTFDTQFFPVESAVRSLDSVVRLTSSTIDRDPLYRRVYGTLALLFTTKVPT